MAIEARPTLLAFLTGDLDLLPGARAVDQVVQQNDLRVPAHTPCTPCPSHTCSDDFAASCALQLSAAIS